MLLLVKKNHDVLQSFKWLDSPAAQDSFTLNMHESASRISYEETIDLHPNFIMTEEL